MVKKSKITGKKKNTADSKIKKMVGRIVSRFSPDKIILFGSYARGNAGPDSDIDLLVIMPITGSRRQKVIEVGAALHDISIPKDLIVVTPQEFEWRKDIVGTIEHPAARDGKVLYVRK